MKVKKDAVSVVKNINAIVANVSSLVHLGAAHLLPTSVVKCVHEADSATEVANDAVSVLRAMCEDPGTKS